NCDEADKDWVLAKLKERLDQKQQDFEEAISRLRELEHIDELIDHYSIYTSDDRLRLLRKVLEHRSMNSDSVSFEQYRTEVIPMRNDLAHMRVKKEGFSRKFYNRKNEEFTAKDMKELRVRVLEFQEALVRLFPRRG